MPYGELVGTTERITL